jgi:hypothetical protein
VTRLPCMDSLMFSLHMVTLNDPCSIKDLRASSVVYIILPREVEGQAY